MQIHRSISYLPWSPDRFGRSTSHWGQNTSYQRCTSNVTELKAFLGLFQFYSRYVPNVADKLGPLYHRLQKGVSRRWKTDHSLAFQQAKKTTNRVLVNYDPKKELILTCDVSQYGVGAVLSHIMANNSEKPVAYCRRKKLASLIMKD